VAFILPTFTEGGNIDLPHKTIGFFRSATVARSVAR
jgi:hypothetical protein